MDTSIFLRASILQIVWSRPSAHGYEIAKLLEGDYGFENVSAVMYRRLRDLEDRGLVASSWLKSPFGPRRRVYTITGRGLAALSELDDAVRDDHGRKSMYLQRAEEMSA